MTRSDYIKLACALANTRPTVAKDVDWLDHDAHEQWLSDCAAICDAIASDNGAFDKALFLTNCGVQS